jgi:CBS domain containing-hemolysin-like protein
MTDNPLAVIVVTTLLIVLSAFFVAAEFALLAVRRHRLEERAGDSRSARAALRSYNELTVLLAGCQLGITACALALGAITKPAVKYALTPLIADLGGPAWVADAGGFVLALIVVTFLHLVIGEMAPKSWAIAHPETAATVLALPMRAFMWLTRPLLRFLNEAANWCLRRVGVEPQDSVMTSQTAADLRQLVEHSANVGALDASFSTQMTEAIDLAELTLADLVRLDRPLAAVPSDAPIEAVQDAARTTGPLRILLADGGAVTDVVHVRDTLDQAPGTAARAFARPVLEIGADTPVYAALATMRETRNHLVLVTSPEGRGVVTLSDVLERLLPTAAAR